MHTVRALLLLSVVVCAFGQRVPNNVNELKNNRCVQLLLQGANVGQKDQKLAQCFNSVRNVSVGAQLKKQFFGRCVARAFNILEGDGRTLRTSELRQGLQRSQISGSERDNFSRNLDTCESSYGRAFGPCMELLCPGLN